MKYFRELDLNQLRDKTIILDIDGTIIVDGGEIQEREKKKLDELKRIAKEVILVSNGHPDRTKKIAEIHDVLAHVSDHQKPNPKVLHNISIDNAVVVGDKFLTDGLLALQSGLPFIHVKSMKGEKDTFGNNFALTYLIDDIIGNTFELFRLSRPKQWIKNFLVFAPAFFAGVIFQVPILVNSLLAFLVFSASASLIYVLNDLNDRSSDRMHYKKKWRPIACYNISVTKAVVFAICLFVLTGVLLIYLPVILPVIALYIVTNIIYTLKLKHIPIFDAVTVASMYVMRVVVGGLATGLFVSPWLIACTFFASLFMISCKRFVEFQNPVRSVLRRYTQQTLVAMLVMSATLSVIGYVLYTILGSHIEHVLYTSVFVIAVFMIMLNDIFNGNTKLETPEVYLLTNRHIRFVLLGYILVMFYLVYLI